MPQITQGETARALEDLVEILSTLDLKYFVCGSFASGAHGDFRATNDIDIVCSISDSHVNSFVSIASNSFYADKNHILSSIQQNIAFNIIHKTFFVKVDVFSKIGPLEKLEFTRTQEFLPLTSGSGRKAKIASPEYSIIAKLIWWKKGGEVSDRQLKDVKGVLSLKKGLLDNDYLDKWAKEFKVSKILSLLRKEI